MPGPALPKASDTFRTTAQASLFGFPPQSLEVTVRPRSRGWRAAGAAQRMGVAVVIAPFVAVFPPHAVWFLGSLAAGAFLAGRRWSERFTLVAVDGKCPKCEEQLDVRPGRLKVPHPLTCEACHHASTLLLPDTALEGHDPDTA